MKKNQGLITLIIAVVVIGGIFYSQNKPKTTAEFFTIGTGGPTGVYFQTGNSICKMLHKYATSSAHGRNKAATEKAYRCTAPSTVDLIIILEKSKKANFILA